jgi:hypothetical protein
LRVRILRDLGKDLPLREASVLDRQRELTQSTPHR